MPLGSNLSAQTLGRIAWMGVVAGGLLAVLGQVLRAPLLGWMALGLIAVAFVAACWLGGYALQDLRADQKDDTEAK